MKTFNLSIVLLILVIVSKAQTVINKKIVTGTNKTTFLIFPSDVKFFDAGSEAIGVEQTDNTKILRLKAANVGFKETNLTVMCEGDQFFSFLINYSSNPDTLNYILKGRAVSALNKAETVAEEDKSKEKGNTGFEEQIKAINEQNKSQSMIIGVKNEGIILALKGIYIKNNQLFFAFQFVNSTKIPYDIDFIKFLVKNKKKSRQTSIQENEITPIATLPRITTLKNGEPAEMIMVFNKFTFPSSKKLVIDMWDKSGERNVSVELSGSQIFKAKQI